MCVCLQMFARGFIWLCLGRGNEVRKHEGGKNGMNATTRRTLQTILYMLLNRVGGIFGWVGTLIVYVRIVGW